MSLDVYLVGETKRVPCMCQCGHEHTREEEEEFYSDNITHNLNKMADAAGLYLALWYPEKLGIIKARHLIDHLAAGIKELHACRARLELLNPSNGWGSYEGLVGFVERYHAACSRHQDANVKVSR